MKLSKAKEVNKKLLMKVKVDTMVFLKEVKVSKEIKTGEGPGAYNNEGD